MSDDACRHRCDVDRTPLDEGEIRVVVGDAIDAVVVDRHAVEGRQQVGRSDGAADAVGTDAMEAIAGDPQLAHGGGTQTVHTGAADRVARDMGDQVVEHVAPFHPDQLYPGKGGRDVCQGQSQVHELVAGEGQIPGGAAFGHHQRAAPHAVDHVVRDDCVLDALDNRDRVALQVTQAIGADPHPVECDRVEALLEHDAIAATIGAAFAHTADFIALDGQPVHAGTNAVARGVDHVVGNGEGGAGHHGAGGHDG
ncbi:MAG: hypothetical protein CVT76_05055, partial [Alphaproteobacteria bacterium HGW-Alphaproteobacteria-15]